MDIIKSLTYYEQEKIMILKITPLDGQDDDMLNFSWTVKDFKKSIMTIKLSFKNPLSISYSQFNTLEITFKDPSTFRNSKRSQSI